MRGAVSLYKTTIGKKVVMAVTGLMLLGFVIGHLLGNLKIFLGPEEFNHYAEGLRLIGDPLLGEEYLLWIARAGLLAALLLHVVAAVQLDVITRKARGASAMRYKKNEVLAFSGASYSMRWGGIFIGAYIIFHLLHLTVGKIGPHEMMAGQYIEELPNAYANVVNSFKIPWLSLIYIVAMFPLAMHIYHGFWSTTQTLGLTNPKIEKYRRPAAAGLALFVLLGYLSIPLAVLGGFVR